MKEAIEAAASSEVADLMRQAMNYITEGRHDQALSAFERVIVLQPSNWDALNNLGCMQLELRRNREALTNFERALELRPDAAEAWRNRASALTSLGDHSGALSSLDRSLSFRPDFAEAINDRILVLMLLGQRAEALQSLENALNMTPIPADAFRNSAARLFRMGHSQDAIAVLAGVIRMRPSPAVLNDHGDLLARAGRFEDALASFEHAAALKPDYVLALHNRASMLAELERFEEALEGFGDALRAKPDFAEAYDRRGIVLEALHRFDEALESYDYALKIRPEFASARWNQALCRLKLGRMPEAWRDYEMRWHVHSLGASPRRNAGHLWTGRADLKGKSILLHAEQGLGDTLQFVRYASMVAAQGARVVLEVPAVLAFMAQSLAGVAEVVVAGEPLPATDFHCPLLSLPLAFQTSLGSIPPAPYLAAPADRAAHWRNRLPPQTGLRIGIAWSGNVSFRYNNQRSMALAQLAPVLELPGVQFINLQLEVPPADMETLRRANPVDLTSEIRDFADTAALVSLLDLVITVDTSVAHLAGALGKPVWIMLHRAADWRWFVDRRDCPWYPSAELIRQPVAGDWNSVIGAVKEKLSPALSAGWPSDSKGWKEQANRSIAERRFFAAAFALERALEQGQGDPETHNNLGNVLCEIGRFPDAETSYRRALQMKANYVEAYSNLGTALHAMKRFDEAEAQYRKALALNPSYHPGHLNLANILRETKRYAEAEVSYRRVVELVPEEGSAHNNLGNIVGTLGRLRESEACYRRALELSPQNVDYLCNLGAALREQGKYSEAEGCYRAAINLRSDSNLAYCNLGNILRDMGRHGEAEACLRRALELNPHSSNAYYVLGALYRDLGRATEAEECCRRSIQLVPTNSDVHNNLANALGDLGRPLEAETFYKRALEIQPSNAPAHSNLLFLYAYFGMCSGERYLEHAKGWERAVIPESARLAARTKAFTRAPRAGRELRVGYVSGDFREHAVSCFMEQVFEAHDRKRFRLFAYPTSGVHDSTTDRMQRLIPEWHSLLGLNTDEALQMIEGHHIDVLIDLSGHTAFNRMDVFARRAAPVQCQYLGYFASTGLTEMDYFIADRDLVPASHDGQYSEQVWRLPRVWASYKPPEEVPAAEWRPDPEGKVWFGSFNHLGKVTPYTIEVWARLLRRVPHACLLLKTKELDDPQNRRRLVNAFAQHGIAGSRIELLGRTPDWKAHMRLYNRLDVALDPVGGNGGATTTCDALWMGVPVVTIAGARYGERMSHSILSAIGRGEWSTANESEYIERAAEIAADPRLIGYVRATQREAIRHTPLVDPQGMARALEDAYDAMFDRWLVRRPT